MIDKALEFTCEVLGRFLRNRLSPDEDKLVLNTIIDPDGTVPKENQNKLVLTLINIDNETNRPFYVRNEKTANDQYSNINISERFNLYILISANFDDYREGLKFLNMAILFLQAHTRLDIQEYPQMPSGLTRLELDIEKITYHQMHSLWTSMGAKYQPSVIYKMRLVTIQSGIGTGFTPAINQSANQVNV